MLRKYGNKKIKAYGYSFDSKLERAVFEMLLIWQNSGDIKDLRHHPGTVYLSEAKIGYRPDFCWTNAKDGQLIYGEAKGYETDVYKIKKKLWAFYGPSILLVWKGSPKYLKLTETIVPRTN